MPTLPNSPLSPVILRTAHLVSLLYVPCIHAGEPVHAPQQTERVLFLDRRVVAEVENAQLELGLPQKHPRNPLLESDKPWENATNNYYPNVTWDEDQRLWKLWYKDVLADNDAIERMEAPSRVHNVGWYLLHATSKDGLAWDRPALNLHRFEGSGANNIVFRDCPNVGVFRDPRDPDPARRFKMVYDLGLGRPRVNFSSDGVHWGEALEVQGFQATQGDTHNNAFFDERLGKYLWFTKMYLGERFVSCLESTDFLNWKTRGNGVLLRSEPEEGRAHQTYALTAFPYANGYLGYLMMYHLGTGRKVDCELAWSPDALHWERIAPGKPFLANGPEGSYDGGCIYAQAGPVVLQDGRIQIYYGGSPTAHYGWKRSGHLCLATLPEDGFAGFTVLDAGAPGKVATTALRLKAPEAEPVFEGEVSVETRKLGPDTLQLVFTLGPGAKLYAVRGVELADATLKPKPEPPIETGPAREHPWRIDFRTGTNAWKGADRIEHLPQEGCVRITRANGLTPFLSGNPVPGEWAQFLGGERVTLSARVRTPVSGRRIRVEVFAQDLAQWWYEDKTPTGEGWSRIEATFRYNWNDEEALAAGWNRAVHAFSWRQTMQHAAKIVLIPSPATPSDALDLEEVSLSAQ